jgi:hypothetical protein
MQRSCWGVYDWEEEEEGEEEDGSPPSSSSPSSQKKASRKDLIDHRPDPFKADPRPMRLRIPSPPPRPPPIESPSPRSIEQRSPPHWPGGLRFVLHDFKRPTTPRGTRPSPERAIPVRYWLTAEEYQRLEESPQHASSSDQQSPSQEGPLVLPPAPPIPAPRRPRPGGQGLEGDHT